MASAGLAAPKIIAPASKGPVKFTRISNISNQMIPIQIRRPNGDFFLEERQIRIGRGKSVVLPTDYLMPAQITNLRVKGKLQTSVAPTAN